MSVQRATRSAAEPLAAMGARLRDLLGSGSRRERVRQRRQRRARAHLARVRGVRRRPPRPAVVACAAALGSVSLGAIAGEPIVGAAHAWIGGDATPAVAISVVGAHHLAPTEVARATGLAPGSPLGVAPAAEIGARLRAHPWIREARVMALPTGRLLVEVTEREPRAVVRIGEPGAPYAVDESGLPFAAVGSAELDVPTLVARARIVAGEASEALAGAVALAYRLPAFELPLPIEVSVAAESDPEGFALRLPRLVPRVVLGRSELDERLAALARLLAAAPVELMDSETLDLRFADQAVLRGTPAPPGSAQAAAPRGRAAPSRARPTG